MRRCRSLTVIAEVPTSNGRPFLVDEVSVNAELSYNWNDGFRAVYVLASLRFRWLGRERIDYPVSNVKAGGKDRALYPHRLVSQAPTGLIVDHINHDTGDNRLANLRLATRSENQANQRSRRIRKCQFIGVRVHAKGWRRPYYATIKKENRQYVSNCFETEVEAARWYDAKALELYGPFARLNFPEVALSN